MACNKTNNDNLPQNVRNSKGSIMEVFIFLLAVNLQKFDFVISFYVLLDKW